MMTFQTIKWRTDYVVIPCLMKNLIVKLPSIYFYLYNWHFFKQRIIMSWAEVYILVKIWTECPCTAVRWFMAHIFSSSKNYTTAVRRNASLKKYNKKALFQAGILCKNPCLAQLPSSVQVASMSKEDKPHTRNSFCAF